MVSLAFTPCGYQNHMKPRLLVIRGYLVAPRMGPEVVSAVVLF